MKNLASDESHYKEISDSNLASDLPNVLSGLAQTITSNIPAAKTLTLTDVVNTDEFELDNDSLTPGLSNNNGILTWKFDNFPEVGNASDEKSVSFKVTPKNDAYGVCYTNKNVSVTYNDGLSNEAKTIGKDVIGDPKVTLYKAVYLKDDTDNAEELTHFGGLASIEQNVPQPETKPEKDGYTFVKWDNGTISQDGYVKTYKPVWEKNAPTQYTVNYHIGDKVVKTEAVNKGDKTTAPEDLTKEGYHLDGWYTSAECKGNKYAFDTPVTGNLDLYAKWEKDAPTQYTVNYHIGDNVVKTETVNKGDKTTAPENLTKEGYHLDGWYTSAECKGNKYAFDTPVTGNLDLYAKWEKDAPTQYTVNYHIRDKLVKTETVNKGDKTTAPENLTKEGYHLDGWYTSEDCTGDKYAFDTPVTGDLDLYAKWEKDDTPVTPVTPVTNHTVTFHPANGQDNFTQTVADGNKVSQPADPTQDGYTFNGWYTDSAHTNAYDFDTPVNKDIDLYAKWTKNNPSPNPEKKVKGILLPKVIANGSSKQTLTWTPLTNVDGYFVYEAYCNTYKNVHAFKKVADVSIASPRVYKRSGLKKGAAYKYYVAGYQIKDGKKQIVKKSVTVHSAAGNLLKTKNVRYTNVKSVRVKKNAVTLKIGKTYKIQPSVKGVYSGYAILQKSHAPMYRYLYIKDGKNISVDQNGNVKALKAGKCNVYVLGTNGVRTKVAVTVK